MESLYYSVILGLMELSPGLVKLAKFIPGLLFFGLIYWGIRRWSKRITRINDTPVAGQIKLHIKYPGGYSRGHVSVDREDLISLLCEALARDRQAAGRDARGNR